MDAPSHSSRLIDTRHYLEHDLRRLDEVLAPIRHLAEDRVVSTRIKYAVAPITPVLVETPCDCVDIGLEQCFQALQPVLRHPHLHHQARPSGKSPEFFPQ